jgi:hypothetical protein
LAVSVVLPAASPRDFSPALRQQEEMKLRQQGQAAQQQRELMARADKDRSDLWKTISEHARSMLAQGVPQDGIMKALAGPVQALERLTKSRGHDPSLVAPSLGMILSQSSPADILGGGGGQQRAQPARDTAFDQAPQSFTPGMQQGPSPGDAGAVPFMSGQVGGAMQPAAGPAIQPFGGQHPEVNAVLDEQINRTLRAMQAARTPEERKFIARQADVLLAQRSGKGVKTFPMQDGSGLHVYDPSTDEMHDVPFPKTAEDQTTQQSEPLYGMRPLKPAEIKTLDSVNVGPKQFDFEAVQVAFGNTQLLVSAGRDKASVQYRRMLNARATDYWMAKGLKPEDANAAKLEFAAMAKGAQTVGHIEARMTVALEKAKATAPIVIDASKKIPRTDYPALNSLILNWEEHIGDPNLPPFMVALETLAMNYGSALGMGNSVLTDSMAQHARDLIKKGWSQGQLESGIAQMLNELDREKGATHRSLHTFLGSSPTTNSQFGQEPSPDAATPPAAAPSAVPQGGLQGTTPGGLQWREVQ